MTRLNENLAYRPGQGSSSTGDVGGMKQQIKELQEALKRKDGVIREQRMKIAMNAIENDYEGPEIGGMPEKKTFKVNLGRSRKREQEEEKSKDELVKENMELRKELNEMRKVIEQKDARIQQCELLLRKKSNGLIS